MSLITLRNFCIVVSLLLILFLITGEFFKGRAKTDIKNEDFNSAIINLNLCSNALFGNQVKQCQFMLGQIYLEKNSSYYKPDLGEQVMLLSSKEGYSRAQLYILENWMISNNNYQYAAELANDLHKTGNRKASLALAKYHIDKNPNLAEQLLIDLVTTNETRDSEASKLLVAFYSSHDSENLLLMAEVLLRESKSNPSAAFQVGLMMENGRILRKNSSSAYQQYSRCARLGKPECQEKLVQFRLKGIGVKRNLVIAYLWHRVLALKSPAFKATAKPIADKLNKKQLKRIANLLDTCFVNLKKCKK
jgi:TPR repeat protein